MEFSESPVRPSGADDGTVWRNKENIDYEVNYAHTFSTLTYHLLAAVFDI